MTDPSASSGLDPQRLSNLRESLAQTSVPTIHRSQTAPIQVGRAAVEGQFFPKLPSRSHTMPILVEGTAKNIIPFKLDLSSQGTATPDYMVEKLDLEAQPPTPLKPVRRSSPVLAQSNKSALSTIKNQAPHSHRLLIGWSISCFALLIIAPLISAILGATLPTPNLSYPIYNTTFSGRSLGISTFLVSADPQKSVATFDWIIETGSDYLTSPDDSNGPCANATPDNPGDCTDVNIFIDSNLLSGMENNLGQSTDVPTEPLFRYNAINSFNQNTKASSPFFRTNIRVFSKDENSRSSLVNYPFDVYTASIFMFAQDTRNRSVGLQIIGSSGNAVGFTTSAVPCPGFEDGSTGMICISVTIKRGGLVRAFCIIVIIAVWLITLVLLLLTLTSIIFGFRQRVEVLVVPVATIFSFTQLRSSMPGAPTGFGDILDFVGLLPCLGILSFSAALSLGAFILTDPTQKTEVLTWGRLRRELLHTCRRNKPSSDTENQCGEGETECPSGV